MMDACVATQILGVAEQGLFSDSISDMPLVTVILDFCRCMHKENGKNHVHKACDSPTEPRCVSPGRDKRCFSVRYASKGIVLRGKSKTGSEDPGLGSLGFHTLGLRSAWWIIIMY